MNYFSFKDGVLHVDNISVLEIEKKCATPVYIYSELCLSNNYKALEEALENKLGKSHPKLIAYSVKANSNVAVINVLKKINSGADVVSSGELKRVIKAGITGENIVFSGVGKTKDELSFALDADVMQFNIESISELEMLSEIASFKNKKAPIAFRINPDIDAGGHEKISTGGNSTKFGIPYKQAINAYEYAKNLPLIIINADEYPLHIPKWFATAYKKGDIKPIIVTPTFILWDEKQKVEIDRLVGYIGKEWFYDQLAYKTYDLIDTTFIRHNINKL